MNHPHHPKHMSNKMSYIKQTVKVPNFWILLPHETLMKMYFVVKHFEKDLNRSVVEF